MSVIEFPRTIRGSKSSTKRLNQLRLRLLRTQVLMLEIRLEIAKERKRQAEAKGAASETRRAGVSHPECG